MNTMQTGIGTTATRDPDEILYQALAAAAVHCLANQVVLDAGILTFHQEAAENLHHGTEQFDPQDERVLWQQMMKIVWKYHILAPNGVGTRISPVIEFMTNGTPIPQTDPMLMTIVQMVPKFQQALTFGGFTRTVAEIIDVSAVTEMPQDQLEQLIMNSYPEQDLDSVNVAVFEDDTVQCACDYCQGFFQILDYPVELWELNPIQQILVRHMHLLDDLDNA